MRDDELAIAYRDRLAAQTVVLHRSVSLAQPVSSSG
jgi:hypothetical protein